MHSPSPQLFIFIPGFKLCKRHSHTTEKRECIAKNCVTASGSSLLFVAHRQTWGENGHSLWTDRRFAGDWRGQAASSTEWDGTAKAVMNGNRLSFEPDNLQNNGAPFLEQICTLITCCRLLSNIRLFCSPVQFFLNFSSQLWLRPDNPISSRLAFLFCPILILKGPPRSYSITATCSLARLWYWSYSSSAPSSSSLTFGSAKYSCSFCSNWPTNYIWGHIMFAFPSYYTSTACRRRNRSGPHLPSTWDGI